MPVSYSMTWKKSGRWTRQFRGKRYEVSCAQLGMPPHKEASRQAANEWWAVKEAELKGTAKPGSPEAISRVLNAYAGKELEPEEVPAAMLGFMSYLQDMPKGNCALRSCECA